MNSHCVGSTVQVIISWTAEDGTFVQRVVTRCLQVTVNRSTALKGVNCEASALLLAKRILQGAIVKEAAAKPKEAARLQRGIGEPLLATQYPPGGPAQAATAIAVPVIKSFTIFCTLAP